MTFWSSSLLLPETRTASPWICDLTFGNSSRMSLVMPLGDLVGQAAPQLDLLADLVAAGRLDLAPVEDLERQVAPDRLRLDEVLDRGGPVLVVGDEDELVLRLRQVDRDALEVVALADLAPDLVERVAQLLLVEVAHDVERDIACHASSLRYAPADDSRRCHHSRNRAIRPSAAISIVMKPASRTRARSARPT